MKNILYVFLISILPIIELRGAIPVGAALGIPFYLNYIAAVIGNLLPVPFILLFIPKILDFLARFRFFRPIVEWVRQKAHKYSARILHREGGEENRKPRRFGGAFWGLLLFVMIPIPGTGAWTGSLIASLFRLPKRSSFLAILLGVLGAGVIMCLASYGAVGFLKVFL
jgi:uncharacterized membrane protein